MARRVRLQVLDDSLPAGVEPCCGNCLHSRFVDSVDSDHPYRVAFPLRCRLQRPGSWMPGDKDARAFPTQLCAIVNDLTYEHENHQLWVRPEFGCINWEPKDA